MCGNEADNFCVFMDSAAAGCITQESFCRDGSGSGFFPVVTSENRNLNLLQLCPNDLIAPAFQ